MLKGSHVMFPAASAPPMLFTLVLLNGLSAASLNMFLPSLSNIAADFQAGYGLLASASIAGYAGMTTVLQLLIGPLSDRVGRRPVILVKSRDLCSCFAWLLAGEGRLDFLALSHDAGRDRFRVRAVAGDHTGYRTCAESGKPHGLSIYRVGNRTNVGPMLGGAFDQLFGWRANFWAFLGFGAGMLALCWIDLGETNKNPSDNFTKQFKAFPSLFRSRRFWGYSLCMAFSMGALYAFLAAAPLVATTVFQMSPASSDSIWEAPPRASFSAVLSLGNLQRAIDSQR